MRGLLLDWRLVKFILMFCVVSHWVQAAESFAPKSITMLISSDSGEGTDQAARLVGPYLSKYLPSHPSIVYLNVPGAGGIKGVNDFVIKAKPDGLTAVASSAGAIDPATLRNPAVRYDPKKFQMFGGFPAPNGPLILRKDAVARFNDKSQNPVVMGDVSGLRNTDQMAVWGPAYLGWNVRWVLGYKSTPEFVLAAIRGEVDLICTYDATLLKQVADTGLFVFPVQTGINKGGKLVGTVEYPGVPVFSDLIRPLLKDPLETRAFTSWEAIMQIGKWFALPQDTPSGIVQIYRDAFDKAVNDKTFAADAVKVFGDNYTVVSGADMQHVTDVADTVGEDELAYMDKLREKVGIRIER